jgi:hypothetical protein
MKIYSIILLALLTSCSALKNNTLNKEKISIPKYHSLKHFKSDTLKFIENSILKRKEYYIGKEMNILLKDLDIPIKKYLTGISSKRVEDPGLYINIFDNHQQVAKIKNKSNPIQISILWKTPLPREETSKLIKSSQLNWTEEVAKYYGKQIIGDIGIVEYNFK